MPRVNSTRRCASKNVKQEDYDTVFYPGGHGPMWDLAEDPNSVMLIESFLAAGKPVALVCHAPGVLRHVKTPSGKPLVEGKTVTGFTNGEEVGGSSVAAAYFAGVVAVMKAAQPRLRATHIVTIARSPANNCCPRSAAAVVLVREIPSLSRFWIP